jgi:putative phosphoesterase
MKIAILSDIHSNVYALKKVIKDAKKKGITNFINLGDTLYGPIQPNKTYKLLKKNNFIHICGNQDRQIFDASKKEIADNKTLQFIVKNLDKKALSWMKNFHKTYTFEGILLCHGTPNDDLTYLLEKIKKGKLTLNDDKHIVRHLSNVQEKIVLCGHSHLPRIIETSKNQIVINPGSVGLQAYRDDLPKHKVENFNSLASYAIIDKNDLDFKVELVQVSYNKEKAIECALKNNRKDWAYALEFGSVK